MNFSSLSWLSRKTSESCVAVTVALRHPRSSRDNSPKKSPRGGDFEDDAFAGVVLEIDLHLAGVDDVNGVPGFVDVKDRFAGGVTDDFELLGEFGAFAIIEELEERHFLQKIGFGRHGL